MKMTSRQFAKYLKRDRHCLHCGKTDDTLIPQHRINRGMGGSKILDRPSNIIVMCSLFNGLIESDFDRAMKAKEYGWKLDSWEDPLTSPVYDMVAGKWFLLDDEFTKSLFISSK